MSPTLRIVRPGAGLALAAMLWPLAGAAGPCAVETQSAARAACLDHAAEVALNATDARIERFAGTVQGGGAASARFAEDARARQADWRREMEAACGSKPDRVARAACRREAAIARDRAVASLLAEAAAALGTGGALDPALGDVEILVPLPRPPRGPALPYLELDPDALLAPPAGAQFPN